jgi:branched-chain amino acid aminotransferase
MPDELGHAQEVFPTGTAAEITLVGEIDSYCFTPGTITKALMADFDKALGCG